MKFKPGDKVVWSHKQGAIHGAQSVLKKSAVLADDPTAQFGEILQAANAENTWFDVALEGESESRTLTGDELVLVSSEE